MSVRIQNLLHFVTSISMILLITGCALAQTGQDDKTKPAEGKKPTMTLKGIRVDDWMFGVAACAGAYCSPVSSAVPGGAFAPVGKE